MKKIDEINHPDSCFNKAKDDEMIFVLRSTDPSAPIAIMAWITDRIRIGKNKFSNQKIQDAFNCAEVMEKERNKIEGGVTR